MRIIKFRGKSIDGKEWLYGDLVSSADKKRFAILVNNKESYDECEVDSETVGQFTELYDCNDKEIYEGDILKWSNGRMYVVKFWEGIFYASIEECNDGFLGGFFLFQLSDYKYGDCEIVGNIFDNPELLKGGEE